MLSYFVWYLLQQEVIVVIDLRLIGYWEAFLRVDERSLDSYLGHDDFFQEKSKTCSGSNLLFRGLTFYFF